MLGKPRSGGVLTWIGRARSASVGLLNQIANDEVVLPAIQCDFVGARFAPRVRLTLRGRINRSDAVPRVSDRRGTTPPQYPALDDE